MTKEELIPVNVWLSGRSYRLRIKPGEESAVRKAVKLADDQVTELRQHYAGKDDQDFMAMCLLMYAANSTVDVFSNPLLKAEINKMTAKIDKVLSKAE